MATTNNFQRDYPKVIVLRLDKTNNGSGNAETAKFPADIAVVDVKFVTAAAFNGTGAVTGTVTDGTTAFVSAQDVKSTGIETVAAAAKVMSSAGTFSAYITDANSDSTAGDAVAVITYVHITGSKEIYG